MYQVWNARTGQVTQQHSENSIFSVLKVVKGENRQKYANMVSSCTSYNKFKTYRPNWLVIDSSNLEWRNWIQELGATNVCDYKIIKKCMMLNELKTNKWDIIKPTNYSTIMKGRMYVFVENRITEDYIY